MRIGAVSVFGAAFGQRMALGGAKGDAPVRSCIFILLQGGASHHDLWDPKPDASAEVRGPFQTISTALPGVRFGELAPQTAGIADKLVIVRSMTHKFTNHIAGTYITLTGSTDQPDQDREAHADDFPGPAAILNRLPGRPSAMPRSVSLPNWLSIPGPSNRMPGQYGGFLGAVNDPLLLEGEPHKADFKPLSLALPEGESAGRLRQRLGLSEQLDRAARCLEGELRTRHDYLRQSAFDLVVDGRFARALDVSQEPDAVRARYGRNKFGQSLLLARRLVEAGVQFVGVNEFNQKWDTHGDLARRYRQIVPGLDAGFSGLVADLADNGLLDDTLVVCAGEFGRTPVMNKDAGRDHWPNVYSVLLAGGGLRAGQVFGASDNHGAEVASDAVSPADLLATMWRQLGISPETTIYDRLQRPHALSRGKVIPGIV
jgi:hypothetical protein